MLKLSQIETKRPALSEGVDVETARHHAGLVGDDADGGTADPHEAHDDVGGIAGLHLKESAVVGNVAG